MATVVAKFAYTFPPNPARIVVQCGGCLKSITMLANNAYTVASKSCVTCPNCKDVNQVSWWTGACNGTPPS